MQSKFEIKGAAHYYAQLGLPDKGCAYKALVVCGTFLPRNHVLYLFMLT